jgi:hypothetical protein
MILARVYFQGYIWDFKCSARLSVRLAYHTRYWYLHVCGFYKLICKAFTFPRTLVPSSRWSWQRGWVRLPFPRLSPRNKWRTKTLKRSPYPQLSAFPAQPWRPPPNVTSLMRSSRLLRRWPTKWVGVGFHSSLCINTGLPGYFQSPSLRIASIYPLATGKNHEGGDCFWWAIQL